ncbi:MAG: hypothetical protein WDO73_28960 [Ignavibacteriota bacterium]
MHWRNLALGLTICSALACAADNCPVTKSPDFAFAPPSPYPEAKGKSFYVGTANLWVLVYPSPWRGLPYWPEGYRQKIVWWSEGCRAKTDPLPAIVIGGRRLDGNAPPLVVTGANGSRTTVGFIMSGVNFPTSGCWEITGRFKARS